MAQLSKKLNVSIEKLKKYCAAIILSAITGKIDVIEN
ncbi:hypothetical protein GLO73106DRAFT_00039370 [Gloeocapsa sp. PCC 73106]|nr:hypothetical protein GLO73106DRAFT_00039370 [Gloeocapsa sp. PCC 73106]